MAADDPTPDGYNNLGNRQRRESVKIHKYSQNRDDHGRIVRKVHLWLYPDDRGDKEAVADMDIEVVVSRKPRREFGVRFHLGKRWSETPLDAHLTIAGTGVYVNAGAGWLREVAHRLTGGQGRDLSLSMHGGQLWWKIWTTEEHPRKPWRHSRLRGRDTYQPWRSREGNITTNPLELWLGPKQYHFEDIGTAEGLVALPEAVYPVSLTLRRVTSGYRDGGRRKYQYLDVDWECKGGIPWMYDHSGGWKGSGVYGSSVRVPDCVEGKDWPSIAVAKIAAAATTSRVKTGWTPEHEANLA